MSYPWPKSPNYDTAVELVRWMERQRRLVAPDYVERMQAAAIAAHLNAKDNLIQVLRQRLNRAEERLEMAHVEFAPSLTAQQVFDTVARHLFAQGERAMDSEGQCLYRAAGGKKCAAGVLITDEEYFSGMENVTFGSARHYEGASGWETAQVAWPPRLLVHEKLIVDLQSVHDSGCAWISRDSMIESLAAVAIKYNLNEEVLR